MEDKFTHWKKEIDEIEGSGGAVAIVNGKPVRCCKARCINCLLRIPGCCDRGCSLIKGREWGLEPYFSSPLLCGDEIALIRLLLKASDKQITYIRRTDLSPTYGLELFSSSENCLESKISISGDLFTSMKAFEPYSVEELIGTAEYEN